MITLFVWCILNILLFHYDPNAMSENTTIIILVICIASDMNLIATLSRK